MDSLHSRNYYKIFVGPNQEEGYENIFLSYEAETSEIVLKADRSIYFHIPFYTSAISIHNSGLIEAGATGGLSPYNSDKIFKKQADYEQYSNWGNSSQKRDGEWACSWLYLSSLDATPVWMDRFYIPGKITYSDALQTVKQDRFVYSVNIPAVYDLPSRLTLDPGVWYTYYHIGNNKIKKALDEISGPERKYLTVNLNSLSSTPLTGIITESSKYGNNFLVDTNKKYLSNKKPYSSAALNSIDYTGTYINTSVQYTSALNFNNNELGINFWITNNNWKQAVNSTLVGNLEKSNYSVDIVNQNNFPFYIIALAEKQLIAFFNQENEVYAFQQLNFTPALITYDYDNNVIVAGDRFVNKYDYTGALISQIKTVREVTDVAVYSNNTIDILEVDKYTNYTSEFTPVSTNIGKYINQGIFIDKNDNRIIGRGDPNLFTVDSNNNIYTARSNYVFLNNKRTSMGVDKTIQKIIIKDNELWALYGNNTIAIFDVLSQKLIKKFNIVNANLAPTTRRTLITFDFIKKYNRETKQLETTILILNNWDKCLYELYLDGTIKRSISLGNMFTGNDIDLTNNFVLRKCITPFSNNQKAYGNKTFIDLKVKAYDTTYKAHYFYTRADISNFLDQNWYLITANFKNNNLQLYINANLASETSVPKNFSIPIKFQNSIYIGQNSGKVASLNEELQSTAIQYNGYLTGIKIYSKTLSLEDIIFLMKENIKQSDIYWNISVNKQQYIEEIERFFKHRLPGNKSNFYNIKITGGSVYSDTVKRKIEEEIKKIINKVTPGHTLLYKIIWQ